MTRINTIDVEDLLDQHLMAEYRELPMVAGSLRRSLRSKNGVRNIPDQFTLNSGHVKFFYNKYPYLVNRYAQLKSELYKRGFKLDEERKVDFHTFGLIDNVDWTPNSRDKYLIAERIVQRVQEKSKDNFYRYYGETVSTAKYCSEIRMKYMEQL